MNMSHLTKMKTCFQNFSYLEKALIKLEIPNFKSNPLAKSTNLMLSKNNDNDLSFNWNGKSFELNVDYDYWNQEYSITHFISCIEKEYATETIIGESKNFGFIPTQISQTKKGRLLELQRFDTSKI